MAERGGNVPQDRDGNQVRMAFALEQWVPVAIDSLVEAAGTYNGYITYKQLTDAVQDITGITHKGGIQNWSGQLLEPIVLHCHRKGLPPLTSLCVHADGTVGVGYRAVLREAGEPIPESLDELDDHAAAARLECYSFFGAELPPGGGKPTLTPKVRAARDRKKAANPVPPKLCTIHFMQLPLTGICSECD